KSSQLRPQCGTELATNLKRRRHWRRLSAAPLRNATFNATEASMLAGILRCRWPFAATTATTIALLSSGLALADDRDGDDAHRMKTTTPIKHVIVLIGENWSFDSVYATYKPRRGQFVNNLLSRGVVDENGQPGDNFFLSTQFQINQPYPNKYFID